MRPFFLVVLGVFTLPPALARAEPGSVDDPPLPPGHTVRRTPLSNGAIPPQSLGALLHLGLYGSPQGMLAGGFEWTPVRQLSWELAAGIGLAGFQIATLVRARPLQFFVGTTPNWFLVGVGPSEGAYRPFDIDPVNGGPKTYPHVWWVNTEIGVESRTPSNFFVRTMVGVSTSVAKGRSTCGSRQVCYLARGANLNPEREGRIILPYVELSVGYSFQ